MRSSGYFFAYLKAATARSIIEDFLGCLSEEQLVDIRKHFIFISYKKDEKELIEIERTIVHIPLQR